MLVTANLEALFKTEERRRSDRTATDNIDKDNVEEEDNEPLQEGKLVKRKSHNSN